MTFSILFDQINHAFPLVTSKFVFQDLSNIFNFKQIIQILHPMVIDYLSPNLYIVDFFKFFFLITFSFQHVFEHSWKI